MIDHGVAFSIYILEGTREDTVEGDPLVILNAGDVLQSETTRYSDKFVDKDVKSCRSLQLLATPRRQRSSWKRTDLNFDLAER